MVWGVELYVAEYQSPSVLRQGFSGVLWQCILAVSWYVCILSAVALGFRPRGTKMFTDGSNRGQETPSMIALATIGGLLCSSLTLVASLVAAAGNRKVENR